MLLLGTRRNLNNHLCHSSELAPGRGLGRRLLGLVRDVKRACAAALTGKERRELRGDLVGLLRLEEVAACVEINQCVGCTR